MATEYFYDKADFYILGRTATYKRMEDYGNKYRENLERERLKREQEREEKDKRKNLEDNLEILEKVLNGEVGLSALLKILNNSSDKLKVGAIIMAMVNKVEIKIRDIKLLIHLKISMNQLVIS